MNIKLLSRFFGCLAVVAIAVTVVALSAGNANALTEAQLEDFAANNIMFYDPGNQSSGCVSLPSGEGVATVSGTTIEEKIWSGLKSLGLTDEVTAGILGNIYYEGSMNPARHETSMRKKHWPMDLAANGNISYGLGLIQWSYGRRIRLYNYVKEQAPGLEDKYFNHPETYSTAPVVSGASFIAKAEEDGVIDEANSLIGLEITFLVNVEMKNSKWYSKVFEETTVEGAAARFAINVEACGNCKPGTSSVKNRSAKAREFYDKYHGNDSFAGGTGGGGGNCNGSNDEDGEDDGEDHTGGEDGGADYGEGGYDGDDYNYEGDVESLQHWIAEYAWPTWWKKAGRKITEQKPSYRTLSGKHGACNGNDCAGFVAKAIQASGWDPNFQYQGVKNMQNTLYNSKTWKEVTSTIQGESDMKPGDVIICSRNSDHHREGCDSTHVVLWAGTISGFGDKIVSASYPGNCAESRAPSASSAKFTIMNYINSQGYSVYRKVRE